MTRALNSLTIKSFYGPEITPYIPALAELRIKVFYDFPYLYKGNLEYEKNYLEIYPKSAKSVLVAAFDGDQIVGAATALPLLDEADYVIAPFKEAQMNLSDIYYFAESVLLKDYRGLGLGHQFFDGRELAAQKFNFKTVCFCAVNRPVDHSQRPTDYRPLDEFWLKRGFVKQPQLMSEFSWCDLDESVETKKKMTYWMRELK